MVMRLKLNWLILSALGAAIVCALVFKSMGTDHSLTVGLVSSCKFVGTMFMNALKMIVVPLIVPSIICGMMGRGDDRNFGRLGGGNLIVI